MQIKIEYVPVRLSSKILIVMFLSFSFLYFWWRLDTFNPNALFFSYTLYILEVYGLINLLLHLLGTVKLSSRRLKTAKKNLKVDIFIPTYNESIDIIRRTVVGALAMDYPHKTWVLDDGSRNEVKELTQQLGARYLPRKNGADAKAGNLNNALSYSSADFIAIFDADHIPNHAFLTNTLGFFDDKGVAFVQTPQDFYNLDSFQHQDKNNGVVWSEQTLFFRVIQRGKDYWNASFFCGSCAVIRKSALDAIGGFATGTITEDLHTSIRFHKAGFKSVYWPFSLAYGLAPSTLKQFLLQRLRWGRGAMQVWHKEGIFFRKGLTLAQKLNYLSSILTYFDGLQKTFYYVIPIIILFSGVAPIETSLESFLLFFIPYMTINYLLFEQLSRGYGGFFTQEKYNGARFFTFLRVALSFFSNFNHKFDVTSKDKTVEHEYLHYAPQVLVVLGSMGAIIYGLLSQSIAIKGVLYVAIFWALFNGYAVIMVLVHAFKSKGHPRKSYRFKLPHPCRIKLKNKVINCLVDDISTGCGLYGTFPLSTKINQLVTGKILLYSGSTFSFKAKVKSMNYGWSVTGERYIKSIGTIFKLNQKNQNFLDSYLFGDNLQHIINNIREHEDTLLDKILNLFHKNSHPITAYQPKDWKILLDSQGMQIGIMATKDRLSKYGRVIFIKKPNTLEYLQVETKESTYNISVSLLSEVLVDFKAYDVLINDVSIAYNQSIPNM